jgi:hypothetical protein
MDDDEKPTMTEQELWEWLHYDEGIRVSRHAIKHAVIDREIARTFIGGCNLFSKRNGWDWLRSRERVGAHGMSKSTAGQP